MRARGGLPRATVALVTCLAAMALPAREACAAVPVAPYVERGLLYGPAQAGISFGLAANTAPIAGSYADTSVDLAIGVTPFLTLDGSLGTLSLSSSARYHGPQAGLWLGLVDTPPLELDATAHVTFGVGCEGPLRQFEPGAAAVLRVGGAVRVDAGAYVPVAFGGTGGLGLRVPASVSLQLDPYIHVTASSGVILPDLQGAEVIVPFGVSLGATVPIGAGGGYAVVSPSLSWPGFSQAPPGPMVMGASLAFVTPP